jgi:uncharacterized protein
MRWQKGYGSLAVALAGLCTAAGTALVGAVSWNTFRRITRPEPTVFDLPELGVDLPRESVMLTSSDGTRLAAWYVPGRRSEPLLLLHGYTAAKKEMLRHAAFLSAAGYPLLLLDLRCCGESEGDGVTFGGREREDVAAALAWLRGRPELDGDRIGILGLSLGGALALMAAAVRAVVAESSFTNVREVVRRNFTFATRLPHFPFGALTVWLVERRWGFRAADIAPDREIARLRDTAVLLIHGENDTIVTVQDAHALYTAAPGPKELWLAPNADHALAYLALREAYAERVTGFFDRWLAPDADVRAGAGASTAAAGSGRYAVAG